VKLIPNRGSILLRLIDRYFGILFLYIIGLVIKKRKQPGKFINIAIFKSAAIGDLVLISALLKDLKNANVDFKITLVLGKDNHALLPLLKYYDKCIKIDVSRPIKAIKRIRKEKFDCFIDLGSWPRIDAVISFFSNSGFVIGYKTKNQYRHFAYDQIIEHDDQIHELDNYRNIFSQLFNIECLSLPALIVPSSTEKFCEDDFILVHMWPGGYKSHFKEWDQGNWHKLFRKIIKDKYLIVLSGTNSDLQNNNYFEIDFGKEKVLNIAGECNLYDLAGIIYQSSLVISVNTGIAHMSAALGKPTLCLNGPTAPVRWAPIGEHVININSTKEGAGFLNLGFEYNRGPGDTMEYISVESVYNSLSAIIK
tara:strand:+ start:1300 stop:2394 length:1095 start_codon:yes stop_codon:yes gene_type:complete